MKLKEIIKEVIEYTQYNDRERIKKWINKIIRELNEGYELKYTEAIWEIEGGAESYKLPEDLIRIIRVFDRNRAVYKQVDYEEYYSRNKREGVYAIKGDEIYITAGEGIRVKYIKRVKELEEDEEENEISKWYSDIVISGAVAEGFRYLEDNERWAIEYRIYREKIEERLKKEAEDRKRNRDRRYYRI